MAGKQKKKKENVLVSVLWLLCGICLGLGLMFSTDLASTLDKGLGYFLIEYGLWMLFLIAAFFVQIVIHEGGHLVFGLLSGYRFMSFRAGRLVIVRENGKTVFRKQNVAGTGGQCLMAPPPYNGGNYPYLLYNFGGVILNLCTVPLGIVLFLVFRNVSAVRTFFFESAVIGFFYALINGIPMKTAAVPNDGYNACHIGDSEAARRSFWTQLQMTGHLYGGARLRDVPEELFFLPDEDETKNLLSASAAAVYESRLLDEHRLEEANALCRRLLDGKANLAGIHRNLLFCDRITTDLLLGNGAVTAGTMKDKETADMMKSMQNSNTVLRTKYIAALLAEGDAAQAEKWKDQFEKVAAGYPAAGETQGDRELMQMALEKYTQAAAVSGS